MVPAIFREQLGDPYGVEMEVDAVCFCGLRLFLMCILRGTMICNKTALRDHHFQLIRSNTRVLGSVLHSKGIRNKFSAAS